MAKPPLSRGATTVIGRNLETGSGDSGFCDFLLTRYLYSHERVMGGGVEVANGRGPANVAVVFWHRKDNQKPHCIRVKTADKP
jgi:hypothetical protein